MGIALSEDIAGTVAAEDTSAAMRYRPAVSSRECALMEEAARLREQVRDLNSLADKQSRLIGQQRDELRTLRGDNDIAAKGCKISFLEIARAQVQVEYEYTPADEPTEDDPGWPEEIVPLRMFVNGRWVDIEDFASALDSDALIDAIKGLSPVVRVRHSLGFEPFPELSIRAAKDQA